MYSLAFERRAAREYQKIRGADKLRIDDALMRLQQDPYESVGVKNLKGQLAGSLRLRVGEWRVIFRVGHQTIVVETIGRRGDVYRG